MERSGRGDPRGWCPLGSAQGKGSGPEVLDLTQPWLGGWETQFWGEWLQCILEQTGSWPYPITVTAHPLLTRRWQM